MLRTVKAMIQSLKVTLKRRRKGYEIVGYGKTLTLRRLR